MRNLRSVAVFFAVSLVLGLVTIHFQHQRAIGELEVPLGGIAARAANAGHALLFYAGKILLPANLIPIYPRWQLEPLNALDFLPWFALAAIAAVSWRHRLTWGRHVLFGFAAFGVMLAPVLGFVPMSYLRLSWVADHFVYLPMIGLIGLITGGVGLAVTWTRPRARWGANAAMLVLALALTIMSRRYAGVFQNEYTLWTYTLGRNPRAWVAHNNLGQVFQKKNQPTEAIAEFEKAIAGDPRSASPHNNLGVVFSGMGKHAEAISHFRTALQLNPKFAEARLNLANSLLQIGQRDEALTEYRETVRLKPNLAEAHNNLGNALYLAGRPQEALAAFRRAVELKPSYSAAHNNLGRILVRAGATAEAILHYKKAVELSPGNPVFRNDLGYALIVAGRHAEAAAELEAALRFKPDHVDALTNLGGLLHQQGDLRRAVEHYEAALRIDPQASDARKNLDLIKQRSPRNE